MCHDGEATCQPGLAQLGQQRAQGWGTGIVPCRRSYSASLQGKSLRPAPPPVMGKAGGSGSSGDRVHALAVFNTDFFRQGFFLIGEKHHNSWSFSALASACSHYLLPPFPSHPAGLSALLHIQRHSPPLSLALLCKFPHSLPHFPPNTPMPYPLTKAKFPSFFGSWPSQGPRLTEA